MHQRVSRGSVCGFKAHGQTSQTAFTRPAERFTVLQQSAVQVQTDISLQTLRETLQHLDTQRRQIRQEKRRQSNGDAKKDRQTGRRLKKNELIKKKNRYNETRKEKKERKQKDRGTERQENMVIKGNE